MDQFSTRYVCGSRKCRSTDRTHSSFVFVRCTRGIQIFHSGSVQGRKRGKGVGKRSPAQSTIKRRSYRNISFSCLQGARAPSAPDCTVQATYWQKPGLRDSILHLYSSVVRGAGPEFSFRERTGQKVWRKGRRRSVRLGVEFIGK